MPFNPKTRRWEPDTFHEPLRPKVDAGRALRKSRLQAQIEEAERVLDAAKAALTAIDSPFGDDVYREGSLIVFRKRFTPKGGIYVYTALKIGNTWSLSGRRRGLMTWGQMLQFLTADYVALTMHPVKVGEPIAVASAA